MTKIDHWALFLITCCFLAAVVAVEPHYLSDKNAFLKEFVGNDLLSLMGVLVSISLASTANNYIQIRKIEDKHGTSAFPSTKIAITKSAHSLIYCLVCSLILVVVKPILPSNDTWTASANSLSIVIVLWGVLVMLDMTRLALKL